MADTQTPDGTNSDSSGSSSTPWGSDFDAAKAWRLVENLRAEVDTLKGQRDSLKTERDALKNDTSSVSDKISAAEKRAQEAEKALFTERALRKHPELADFADLLSGDSEEDVLKKAERLAAIGKKPEDKPAEGEQKPAEGDNADGEQKPAENDGGLPGKPEPALTPGHGGDVPTPFDPVAIAKAARR